MAFRRLIKRDCQGAANSTSIVADIGVLPQPFPMENPNTKCYMNSLVQCLVSLPAVIEDYRLPGTSYWYHVIRTLRDQAEERAEAEGDATIDQPYTEFYRLGIQLIHELGLTCDQEDPKEVLDRLILKETLDPLTFRNTVLSTEVCECDCRGSRDQITQDNMLYNVGKYVQEFSDTSERICEGCNQHPVEHFQLRSTSDVLVALTPLCALQEPQSYGTRIRVHGNIYTLMSQLIYNAGRAYGLSGHYHAEGYRLSNNKIRAYRLDDEQTVCIGSTLKYNPKAVALFYHREKSQSSETENDNCRER